MSLVLCFPLPGFKMGVLNNCLGLGSPYILQLLIINFIGLLGCLSSVALAMTEGSETVTGSVATFPDVGITCIGNLGIFITSLLRGRLDLEVAARDVLATVRVAQLLPIHRFGLTTCNNMRMFLLYCCHISRPILPLDNS